MKNCWAEITVDMSVIDDFARDGAVSVPHPLEPNQGVIMKDYTNRSLLGVFDYKKQVVRKIKYKTPHKTLKPANKDLELIYDHFSNPDIKVILLDGVAGSGKTSTTSAYAAMQAISNKTYNGVTITRPNSEVGKGHGFLPGSLDEKMDPLMAAMYYWINKFTYREINQLKIIGDLQVLPIAYARGINLEKRFFIIDETQNLDKHEIKTLLTRVDDDCRVVILGDSSPNQIDVKGLTPENNGLVHVKENFVGEPWFAWVDLKQILRGTVAKAAVEKL